MNMMNTINTMHTNDTINNTNNNTINTINTMNNTTDREGCRDVGRDVGRDGGRVQTKTEEEGWIGRDGMSEPKGWGACRKIKKKVKNVSSTMVD